MKVEKHPAPADRTLQYIIDSRPLHERLQQVLTQVAGFSLLVMTRGERVPMLDGPAVLAREALRSAQAELRSLRVPAAAMHHAQHIQAAAGAVERALDLLIACLRPAADEPTRAALTRCLRLATDHLRAATRLLPGFEMVDFSQACCAAHAGAGRLACL